MFHQVISFSCDQQRSTQDKDIAFFVGLNQVLILISGFLRNSYNSMFIFLFTLLFISQSYLRLAEAGELPKDIVIARVNKTPITLKDLEEEIVQLHFSDQLEVLQNKLDFLQALVRREMIFQAGKAQGIEKIPNIKKRLEDAWKEIIIDEMIKQHVTDKINVTEAEVKKAFLENEPYLNGETVTASHILVNTEEEARIVRKQLEAGIDFAQLVRERSIDLSSRERGGELGTFPRGTTELEFEEVAFKLKPGEISPIVKSKLGYHIIKVSDYTPPSKTFEDVEEQLKESLAKVQEQRLLAELIERLQKEYKVEIYEDRLK